MKSFRFAILMGASLWIGCSAGLIFAQSINQSQIRGTITDPSGAVIPGAKITITDVGTNISQATTSNGGGGYAFTALGASNYELTVEAPGFATAKRVGITLSVNQQTTLNVALKTATEEVKVTVTSIPVLLDTGNPTLGATIPTAYLTHLPLEGRDPFALTFLAPGVTESAGSGIDDSYPGGTNFISNGQRNSSANIRLDGVLITAPEQGEGGNSGIYFQANEEGLQEVAIENNSTSAEYGGGTIINEQMKSGTNRLHGSVYWFNSDGAYSARDFYNSGPKPGSASNQAGGSLGGPIVKNKTFFFVDFQESRSSSPVNIVGTVPTADEINGDFSQATAFDEDGDLVPNQIYDPFMIDQTTDIRPAYSDNMIPSTEIDPVGQAILKLYPAPNIPGNLTGANNFRDVILSTFDSTQVDAKIDQHFSPKSALSVRFGTIWAKGLTPTVFGDADFNDGNQFTDRIYNSGINYSYAPTPNTLWISTFGLDRVSEPTQDVNYPNLTSVGFPSYLINNGINRMPAIIMADAPWTSLYSQCCVITQFAHTLLNYTSAFQWTKGNQTLKFGGQQWIFYNNFFEPDSPTGNFDFDQFATSESPFDTGNGAQGNDFASLLLGWPNQNSYINVGPPVADKSLQTSFYAQDNWRATTKLTLNLGLRYQWDTPYMERHNNSQFSDFTGDSGISVPGLPGTLLGTTIFASSKRRRLPIYWKNVAPRVGFAYLLNPKLVFRGGAGVYYGYPITTNFQYPGTAYTASPTPFFSLDGGITRNATLEDPFPGGIPEPQGQTYGQLAMWGLNNGNALGNAPARDANIYQWNLGFQQAFPANIIISVNYAANRSTHLPWAGTNNRNFISSAVRTQYTSQQLSNLVDNPFQPLFSGPNAIFDVPSSQYGDDQIPLLNLLRPYPQFDGSFAGNILTEAASWYNALQVVFRKRAGKYLNFEGNYTWSKAMDDSSAGSNDWVGTLGNGSAPQELDHLNREWSISANDATNRAVVAVMFQLPVGRGFLIGSNMNRGLDAVIGGWQLNALTTYQSGQPLAIYMANARLADGSQRPNVTCKMGGLKTGISITTAAITGAPYLNSSCFADPGDQQAGNAPRYFSSIRSDGIRRADLTFEKNFSLESHGHIEFHADCFNCTNTPRFWSPDTGYQDSTFGVISSTAAAPRNMQLGLRYQF
ncbi:MAG: TonB-dependent receptor [Acidobacteriaceae bacterium]